MSGRVMRGHIAVLDLDQNLAVRINQDGAEGMVAAGQGAASDLERAAQKMFVPFRSAHIQKGVHLRSFTSAHHAGGGCDRQASGIRPYTHSRSRPSLEL